MTSLPLVSRLSRFSGRRSSSREVCRTPAKIEALGSGPLVSEAVRRSRRAFGTVERLPSGRFRARVIGPDGRYVSAPATFANRTDAARWVDVQHADLVRGTWQAPVKPSASPSVAAYVARWIEEHPTARDSTKELYRGLLRTCIAPTLGRAACRA